MFRASYRPLVYSCFDVYELALTCTKFFWGRTLVVLGLMETEWDDGAFTVMEGKSYRSSAARLHTVWTLDSSERQESIYLRMGNFGLIEEKEDSFIIDYVNVPWGD